MCHNKDDIAPDPEWLPPPGRLLQQHADPGQADLRQLGPARLHQGWVREILFFRRIKMWFCSQYSAIVDHPYLIEESGSVTTLALFDYWAVLRFIATSKPASSCSKSDLAKFRKYFFCKPWSYFLQSIFGKAGGRAEEGTGGTTQSTLTDRGRWAGAGGKMVAVTIISEKVIISSTRSEEGRLLSRYSLRMTARTQENCTAPLPRAVRLRILNLQNLAIREKKWQHQAEICHHQNQQNIWWTLRIVLNVICEALVQSKKVFYGSRETSCSQGRIKSSFWN